MYRCYHCQKEIRLNSVIETSSVCPNCQKPLQCCFNCHFFSPGAKFQCLQSIKDAIPDKKQKNQCELFKMREIEVQKKIGGQVKAKQQLDDLFGGL